MADASNSFLCSSFPISFLSVVIIGVLCCSARSFRCLLLAPAGVSVFLQGKGLEKIYLLAFSLGKLRKMTTNAETAKNTFQAVFDPRFFHTMLGGSLGNRGSKENKKKTCSPGDMAMRKTTSRLQEPHTFSRPDFAKVHLIWEFFLNRTLSGPPVNTESTFDRPFQKNEKVYLF